MAESLLELIKPLETVLDGERNGKPYSKLYEECVGLCPVTSSDDTLADTQGPEEIIRQKLAELLWNREATYTDTDLDTIYAVIQTIVHQYPKNDYNEDTKKYQCSITYNDFYALPNDVKDVATDETYFYSAVSGYIYVKKFMQDYLQDARMKHTREISRGEYTGRREYTDRDIMSIAPISPYELRKLGIGPLQPVQTTQLDLAPPFVIPPPEQEDIGIDELWNRALGLNPRDEWGLNKRKMLHLGLAVSSCIIGMLPYRMGANIDFNTSITLGVGIGWISCFIYALTYANASSYICEAQNATNPADRVASIVHAHKGFTLATLAVLTPTAIAAYLLMGETLGNTLGIGGIEGQVLGAVYATSLLAFHSYTHYILRHRPAHEAPQTVLEHDARHVQKATIFSITAPIAGAIIGFMIGNAIAFGTTAVEAKSYGITAGALLGVVLGVLYSQMQHPYTGAPLRMLRQIQPNNAVPVNGMNQPLLATQQTPGH